MRFAAALMPISKCRQGGRAAVLALFLAGCQGAERAADRELNGAQLAERHCQSCHMLPQPAELDRETWQRWVLPHMARRLGLRGVGGLWEDEFFESGRGGELVRQAEVFPAEARMSRAAWERIERYYLAAAPERLPASPSRKSIAVGMRDFRVREAVMRIPDPAVTLVKIERRQRRIYVGTMHGEVGTLTGLDAQGRATGATHVASPIAHLRTSGDTLSLLLMGNIHPSDAPHGSYRTVVSSSAGAERSDSRALVNELRRPVHASYGDPDGDGREDVILSEFGHFTGQLAWHQNLGGGRYRANMLKQVPGALTTFVSDADGDGRLDVVALFAQGDEGVYLFRNAGGGRFAEERLVRLPPSLGSTSLDVADMNGDGHWDLVHASGNNGDYPPRAKPYHGIRIFLNDGHYRFQEGYFFPFHGASKVVARDFNGDGRADIAAVSYFPDYTRNAPEPFVYLANRGAMEFAPMTFVNPDRSRWLTLDAGDIDGDGDEDMVLGSFVVQPAAGDRWGRAARWRSGAPTVLILENTRR